MADLKVMGFRTTGRTIDIACCSRIPKTQVGFRKRRFSAVHSLARKSAAVLVDFLHHRLTITSDGCLHYFGDACMALDFATGLSPTHFCIFLQDFAQTNEETVRRS